MSCLVGGYFKEFLSNIEENYYFFIEYKYLVVLNNKYGIVFLGKEVLGYLKVII